MRWRGRPWQRRNFLSRVNSTASLIPFHRWRSETSLRSRIHAEKLQIKQRREEQENVRIWRRPWRSNRAKRPSAYPCLLVFPFVLLSIKQRQLPQRKTYAHLRMRMLHLRISGQWGGARSSLRFPASERGLPAWSDLPREHRWQTEGRQFRATMENRTSRYGELDPERGSLVSLLPLSPEMSIGLSHRGYERRVFNGGRLGTLYHNRDTFLELVAFLQLDHTCHLPRIDAQIKGLYLPPPFLAFKGLSNQAATWIQSLLAKTGRYGWSSSTKDSPWFTGRWYVYTDRLRTWYVSVDANNEEMNNHCESLS